MEEDEREKRGFLNVSKEFADTVVAIAKAGGMSVQEFCDTRLLPQLVDDFDQVRREATARLKAKVAATRAGT